MESNPEGICRAILSALQMSLVWKWDSRFGTFLAEFGVDRKDRVRAVLESHLSNAWDGTSIGKAPPHVQVINGDLGGLMSGQMLFTSDPKQDAFVFCAWWPWGDGNTISIRVAPSYKKLVDPERNEQIKSLREFLRV